MTQIAIIGAGPSGVMAGIFASENLNNNITFFDIKSPLTTILPTGGGRCNLAYGEFDNSELVKFYPRGEKFLLSVFSRFSTADTIDFFEKIGVQTYMQDDFRFFPTSNSSKDVREKLLAQLRRKNVRFVQEGVLNVVENANGYDIVTKNGTTSFDKVVFACGIKNNEKLLSKLGIELVAPRPSLCALDVSDNSLYSLSGLVLPCEIEVLASQKMLYGENGDFLLTHKSLSGPLAYKISAYCAYSDFPWKLKINSARKTFEELDCELVSSLNDNSKKDILNIISKYAPRSFCDFVLKKCALAPDEKAFLIDRTKRQKVAKYLTEYEVDILALKKDGEIVTAGGVNLNFVNSKTMQYKNSANLYFCGEILDIDGLTGGFNLQNCWSTGYLAGKNLAQSEQV